MKKENKTAENKGYRCIKDTDVAREWEGGRMRWKEQEEETIEEVGGRKKERGWDLAIKINSKYKTLEQSLLQLEGPTYHRYFSPLIHVSSSATYINHKDYAAIYLALHWNRETIKIEKAMHDKLHDKVLIMVLKSSLYVIRSVTWRPWALPL